MARSSFLRELFLSSGLRAAVRRECLDHLLILGEAHLRRALRAYVASFNDARPHQGIDQQVPAGVVPAHGVAGMRGRALDRGEVGALFRACAADPTAAGTRDAALLAVLCALGLRRSEVVALDRGDYTAQSEALVVRAGKGNKARLAYATGGAARALDAWLQVRGAEPGPLFWPVNKAGRLTTRRLTDQAVLTILRKRAAQASVPTFSPHDLRRTFISDLLDAGADISTVQSLAGHAQVTTTQRYDRRGEATRRRAAGLLQVPYA